jgi:zinc transport system substrate-binding protein
VLGAALLFAAAIAAAEPVRAFVTILPAAQFVERVGGRDVAVDVLVGPGQSPHTYEPRPRQVGAIEAARAYFRIGLPLEEALLAKVRATNRDLAIVDLRRGVPLLPMTEADPDHPARGGTRTDPHVWMDPRRVKVMAGTIASALSALDPAHAADYARRARAFQVELDALDARIAAALAPARGKDLFVFHPAFGYFADAYGLVQVAVETGGKEPGARRLADLIARVRRNGARVIFVQPQYSRRSAEAIAAETGAAVVPLDTLARDYVGNLAAVADAVRTGLAEVPR